MRDAGGDAIGVDWRVPLDGRGNGSAPAARCRATSIPPPVPLRGRRSNAPRPSPRPRRERDGHVFNLGHGVLPGHARENLQRLVDLVHERTAGERSSADRRAGDGVRHRRAAPTTSSATTRTSAAGGARAGAPRGAARTLRGDRQPFPAAGHHPAAGGGPGAGAQPRRRRDASAPYLGMKHSPPFIAEAVERMREDGIERAIGIVMAPHWSGMSVESYIDRVRQEVGEGPPAFDFVRSYHDHPLRVVPGRPRGRCARRRSTADERRGATVIFSRAQPAHPNGRGRVAPVPACHAARTPAVTATACRDRRPRRGGARSPRLHDRVAERGPDRRSVVGATDRGRARATWRRRGLRPRSCARPGSWPTTSRSCTTSTSRRRRSPSRRHASRAHRDAERGSRVRPRACRRCSRAARGLEDRRSWGRPPCGSWSWVAGSRA